MPKKAAAPEAPASASKAKKATTPRKSASSTPVAAAAAAATAATATLARPSYYNERPTVAAVRATLPQPSGLGKSLRDQYFHWELLTGCYSLEPWEKIAFNFFFFVSLAGVIFYGYKNVSSFVKSLQ